MISAGHPDQCCERSGLDQTQIPDTTVSLKCPQCMDTWRSVGCSSLRPQRGGTGTCSLRGCHARSAKLRWWTVVAGQRAQPRTGTSIRFLHISHCPFTMGNSPYSSHRFEMVRTDHLSPSRPCRLPRKERKVDSSQEGEGQGRDTKAKTQAESKGCRKEPTTGGSNPSCSTVIKDFEVNWEESCRPTTSPSHTSRAALKVPGANAPVSDVLALWSALARWILTSKTEFASFLHAAQTGTTFSPWPMPAPYPEWFSKRQLQSVPRRRTRETVCLQKAVNMVCLALSWLHMQKPSRCPSSLFLVAQLTSAQWHTVWRLESQMKDVGRSGNIGPSQMGRTAARVEGLEAVIGFLHDEAMKVAPPGYVETPRVPASSSTFQNDLEGEWSSELEVVGELKGEGTFFSKGC